MKIIMVCLGNICRSPLAEGIMQHLVDREGLDWEIDSAGTGDWHLGEGPHRGSVRVAAKNGLDISRQVCRLFRVSDFDRFDHIFVMDRSNLANILAMARNQEDAKKVRLLLGDAEVPDPYTTNLFDECYEIVQSGCQRVFEELNKKHE